MKENWSFNKGFRRPNKLVDWVIFDQCFQCF